MENKPRNYLVEKLEILESFKNLHEAVIDSYTYRNVDFLQNPIFEDFWNSLESIKTDLEFIRRNLSENS